MVSVQQSLHSSPYRSGCILLRIPCPRGLARMTDRMGGKKKMLNSSGERTQPWRRSLPTANCPENSSLFSRTRVRMPPRNCPKAVITGTGMPKPASTSHKTVSITTVEPFPPRCTNSLIIQVPCCAMNYGIVRRKTTSCRPIPTIRPRHKDDGMMHTPRKASRLPIHHILRQQPYRRPYLYSYSQYDYHIW